MMTSSRARQWLVWVVVALVVAFWFWPQVQVEGDAGADRESVRTSTPRSERAGGDSGRTAGGGNSDARIESRVGYPAFLPAEAHRTIALIQRGGPYPHRQDGTTFGNREGRLPRKARGWYREFTVETPGLSHRGARRIVTGGDPPSEWFYTDDHYESFREFEMRSDRP